MARAFGVCPLYNRGGAPIANLSLTQCARMVAKDAEARFQCLQHLNSPLLAVKLALAAAPVGLGQAHEDVRCITGVDAARMAAYQAEHLGRSPFDWHRPLLDMWLAYVQSLAESLPVHLPAVSVWLPLRLRGPRWCRLRQHEGSSVGCLFLIDRQIDR